MSQPIDITPIDDAQLTTDLGESVSDCPEVGAGLLRKRTRTSLQKYVVALTNKQEEIDEVAEAWKIERIFLNAQIANIQTRIADMDQQLIKTNKRAQQAWAALSTAQTQFLLPVDPLGTPAIPLQPGNRPLQHQALGAQIETSKKAPDTDQFRYVRRSLSALDEETAITASKFGTIPQSLNSKQQIINANHHTRYQARTNPAPCYPTPAIAATGHFVPDHLNLPPPVPDTTQSDLPSIDTLMDLSVDDFHPDAQEREACQVEGRCIYCGSMRHYIQDCQYAPAPRNPTLQMMGARVDAKNKENKETSSDNVL